MIADLDSRTTTSCLQSALPPSGPFSSLALVVPGPQDSFLHIHEGATELIHTFLLSAQAVPAVAAGSPGAAEHIVSPLHRCCLDTEAAKVE